MVADSRLDHYFDREILESGFSSIPHGMQGEGEDVASKIGLKVKFEEVPEEAEYRGKYRMIGDREHAEIIALYVEEEMSVDKIARQLGRSIRSVHDHLIKHDAKVDKLGYCPRCRRAKGKFETVKAKRESV